MLIQLNDGQVLAVDFKYSVEGDRKPNGHKNRNAGRRSIECRVRLKFFVDRWYDSKNKVHDTKISFFAPVAEGKSTCCLEDKFNKQVGRAIAFSRAIENSFHPYIKDNFEEIIDKYCEIEGISKIKEDKTLTEKEVKGFVKDCIMNRPTTEPEDRPTIPEEFAIPTCDGTYTTRRIYATKENSKSLDIKGDLNVKVTVTNK